MNFSPQQDKALLAVDHWLKQGTNQVLRLFGYAGTGKTTLAKHFAQGVSGLVLYGAYTGKAAHVLRSKGCEGATTIHSMIYNVHEKSRERLAHYEKELTWLKELSHPSEMDLRKITELELLIKGERLNLSSPAFRLNEDSIVKLAKLVVIDECSMVDGRMGHDLLSFGTKILVLGDPAQLPPINGGGYFTSQEPDVMLTEVHRQAKDNPIIDMATRVRRGEPLPLGVYGSSSVTGSVDRQQVMSADQILVGTNATRRRCNSGMREALGMQGFLPVDGDKLVCLRNSQDIGLLNGGLWYVRGVNGSAKSHVDLSIQPDTGGDVVDVRSHTHHFIGEEEKLKDMDWWMRKESEEFDFGYALTVHKSQGSQWNHVYLFDESNVFRDKARQHLYTGLTRAAEKVTVVRR